MTSIDDVVLLPLMQFMDESDFKWKIRILDELKENRNLRVEAYLRWTLSFILNDLLDFENGGQFMSW